MRDKKTADQSHQEKEIVQGPIFISVCLCHIHPSGLVGPCVHHRIKLSLTESSNMCHKVDGNTAAVPRHLHREYSAATHIYGYCGN